MDSNYHTNKNEVKVQDSSGLHLTMYSDGDYLLVQNNKVDGKGLVVHTEMDTLENT